MVFQAGEHHERDGRRYHIHPKEGANAIGEELLKKQRHVEAVLHYPRNKLPIRENNPQKTQSQIDVFLFHVAHLLDTQLPSVSVWSGDGNVGKVGFGTREEVPSLETSVVEHRED